MSSANQTASSPPEREQLALAERAYEAGDFARVRELCAALSRASDGEAAARARALGARVGVDPLALAVIAACVLLFGVIVHAYVL